MKRRATDYQGDTLLASLAAVETAADLDHSERAEIGLVSLGVPWSASTIMGRPAAAIERRALRRAAADLDAEGLLERIPAGIGDRMTHVRLTAKGFARAVELAEGGAALDVIADVLDATDWGKPLARIARKMLRQAAAKTEADSKQTAGPPPAKTSSPSKKDPAK